MKKRKKLRMPMFALVLIAALIAALFAILIITNSMKGRQNPTGMAVAAMGCCGRLCIETDSMSCSDSTFFPGKRCRDLEYCRGGCCIEEGGYCLNNYARGRCEESGHRFVKIECSELIECVEPSRVSFIMSPVGINKRFDPVTGDVLEGSNYSDSYGDVVPFASYRGSFFKIRYSDIFSGEIEGVEALLRDDAGWTQAVQLFDDGDHEDSAANDSMYGSLWDSSSIDFYGIKNLYLDAIITYKNSPIQTKRGLSRFSVVNRVKCMPLKRISGSPAASVVFLGNKYSEIGGLPLQNEHIMEYFNELSAISPFVQNDSIDYYYIDRLFDFYSSEGVLEAIKRDCSFFNAARDIAIIIDDNEEKCTRPYGTYPGIISIKHGSGFLAANNYGLAEALHDPCILTVAGAIESALAELPKVQLLLENNAVFQAGSVTLRFVATDNKDTEIRYSASVGDLVFDRTGQNGGIVELNLSLDVGTYSFIVAASDSTGNVGISNSILINIEAPSPSGD